MAYYASGRVAACVSGVNAYSARFYFYADDPRGTLLCALDEHAVGFAYRGRAERRSPLGPTLAAFARRDGSQFGPSLAAFARRDEARLGRVSQRSLGETEASLG